MSDPFKAMSIFLHPQGQTQFNSSDISIYKLLNTD